MSQAVPPAEQRPNTYGHVEATSQHWCRSMSKEQFRRSFSTPIFHVPLTLYAGQWRRWPCREPCREELPLSPLAMAKASESTGNFLYAHTEFTSDRSVGQCGFMSAGVIIA